MTGNMLLLPPPQLKKTIKQRKPSLFIGLRRGKNIIYPITVFWWRKKAQEMKIWKSKALNATAHIMFPPLGINI